MGTRCSKGAKDQKPDLVNPNTSSVYLMPVSEKMADSSSTDKNWSIAGVFSRESMRDKTQKKGIILASEMRTQLSAHQAHITANRVQINVKSEQLQQLLMDGLSLDVHPDVVRSQSESLMEDVVYLQMIDKTIRRNATELKNQLLSVETRLFSRNHELDKQYLTWAGGTETVHKVDIDLQEKCIEAEDSLQELNSELGALQQSSSFGGTQHANMMKSLYDQQLQIAAAKLKQPAHDHHLLFSAASQKTHVLADSRVTSKGGEAVGGSRTDAAFVIHIDQPGRESCAYDDMFKAVLAEPQNDSSPAPAPAPGAGLQGLLHSIQNNL
jgi:hypothetical protein